MAVECIFALKSSLFLCDCRYIYVYICIKIMQYFLFQDGSDNTDVALVTYMLDGETDPAKKNLQEDK